MGKGKILAIYIIAAITILAAEGIFLAGNYQKNFSVEKFKENPEVKSVTADLEKETRRVIEKSFPAALFSQPISESSTRQISAALDELKSPSLFRIKVFNSSFQIVWSNLSAIIGQVFAGHEEVRTALNNKVAVVVKVHSKGGAKEEDYSTKAAFGNYVEMYVPVVDSNGQVAGVVEVYKTIDDIVRAREKQLLMQGAVIMLLTLAILAAGAVAIQRRKTEI